MKQFSGWQALFLSFSSPALYRDVARNWTGLGFLYLLAVLSITTLVVSVQINKWVSDAIDQNISPICDQMPKLSIENSTAAIDKPCPYKITDPKTGRVIVTFDTRNSEPASDALAESTAVVTSSQLVLVTPTAAPAGDKSNEKNGLPATLNYALENTKDEKSKARLMQLYKEHPEAFTAQSLVFPFTSLPSFSLDQTGLHALAQFYKQWTWLLVFAMSMPVYFVFSVIVVLIEGLVGMAMSRMLNTELSYGALVRLSVVALTPVILLNRVLRVRASSISFWWQLAGLTALALAYLFFAVKSNSAPSPTKSTPIAENAS